MKGELTMRALIILVITFAILATQFRLCDGESGRDFYPG